MKDLGRVMGSAAQALPLIVGKDTVYVHTDIKKVEPVIDEETETEAIVTNEEESEIKSVPTNETIENLYSYNEIQYDKDEYIQLIAEENNKLNEELTNAQLALCDIYEMMK